MSIGWDPKIKGSAPTAPTTTPTAPGSAESANKPGNTPAAMEKPQTLAQPEAAQVHPSRLGPDGKPTRLEAQLHALREQLAGPRAGRLDAAQAAIALAASYAMRRSRGSRRRALDLLDSVEENVEEYGAVAVQLRMVLAAEGEIYELEADATLRACRDLIEGIDDEESSS